jgi:hypothetical protein
MTTNTRWEATQRIMATKRTRQTHKIAIHSGRELYHLQFSLQAVSPETFSYTLITKQRGRGGVFFTADQAGQSAVGLGTEPRLGLLTRYLLSLTFTL